MDNTLRKALSSFESVNDLDAVYQQFRKRSDLALQLGLALNEPDVSVASSYLLKLWLKENQPLLPSTQQHIITAISRHPPWQCLLNCLQCLQYLNLDRAQAKILYASCHNSINHENTFIRAWSYHGLYLAAECLPNKQVEAAKFIQLAYLDEPASVKARIRNTVKRHSFEVRIDQ